MASLRGTRVYQATAGIHRYYTEQTQYRLWWGLWQILLAGEHAGPAGQARRDGYDWYRPGTTCTQRRLLHMCLPSTCPRLCLLGAKVSTTTRTRARAAVSRAREEGISLLLRR